MSITIPLSPEDTRRVSDGFHTFEELYEHRVVLFICLAKRFPGAWKPHYPGWPVLFIETPFGQISYHFPEKFLEAVERNFVRDDSYQWDGHSSEDVLNRLWALATEKSQCPF